ncbi:AAA family ATPase [Plantibacter cousiniae (nom. nud.)]|uniref:AAA domain-containing protein n=1 Tax=Plantibacter cousiniae (nom. nud.) TaxID=199709 RepID=A0ABY1LJQ8_9MICO|nr:AAA family ATPase [Plantibacter cousiniae]SKC50497.1 AAA domain-containing protein [Plantibacter cousiniae]
MDEELSPVTARLTAMVPDTAKPERGERRTVRLTKASAIRTEKQLELKRGQVPLGTLTVVAGRGGEGKSTWVLGWLAEGTHGRLEGDLHGMPITALIVSIEDSWATVMVPRLKAAGADLDRVIRLDVDTTVDTVTTETMPTLPLDIELFRRGIRDSGAKVLVLDPASSLMSGDLNKRIDARQSLDALAALARDEEVAIVLILHLAKGAGSPSDKISGSHALRDAVRSVLMVARVSEDTDERVLTVDKSNYSQSVGQSFAFTIEATTVVTDDGQAVEVGRSVELGPSSTSVGEVMNKVYGEDQDDDRNAAQTFIIDYLKHADGCEANAADVLKAGRAAGFSESELKNARRRARSPQITSGKSGFGAGWVWQLDATDPEGVTKVSKVPGVQALTPSTPSVTPSSDSESERSTS